MCIAFQKSQNDTWRGRQHWLPGLWDSIRDDRLCGRKDCQHCGHCPGETTMIGENFCCMSWSDGMKQAWNSKYSADVLLQLTVHCVNYINIYQVESGNPGESKELRNAREKFNRVFGVSLGEEDRLVISRHIFANLTVIFDLKYRWATIPAHAGKVECLPRDTSIWRCLYCHSLFPLSYRLMLDFPYFHVHRWPTLPFTPSCWV